MKGIAARLGRSGKRGVFALQLKERNPNPRERGIGRTTMTLTTVHNRLPKSYGMCVRADSRRSANERKCKEGEANRARRLDVEFHKSHECRQQLCGSKRDSCASEHRSRLVRVSTIGGLRGSGAGPN